MDGLISPDHLNTLKKIDNLWFNDADVIFCAGSSKFRVYRGILSLQSTVFRDMFSLPQNREGSADARGSGDDVATVIALPDNERDVHLFFLAIFDASFYHPPPSTYALQVTISILCLAHKYNVPFLIQCASSHLASFFPSVKETLARVSNTNTDPDPSQTLKDYLEVLRLAYVTDTQWILPSLLYTIVGTYRISFIMMHPSFAGLEPRSQLLIVECAMGRESEKTHRRAWFGILPSRDCEQKASCRSMSISCERHGPGPATRTGGLDESEAELWFSLVTSYFCQRCRDVLAEHQKKWAEQCWENHAMVCGFNSWDEVRTLRVAALAHVGRIEIGSQP